MRRLMLSGLKSGGVAEEDTSSSSFSLLLSLLPFAVVLYGVFAPPYASLMTLRPADATSCEPRGPLVAAPLRSAVVLVLSGIVVPVSEYFEC